MSIPKDGYYIALVQCDTGGENMMHVEVRGGIPLTRRGTPLRPNACSKFEHVSTSEFCRVWYGDAAMELNALRTANKALVEQVAAYKAVVEDPAALWANWLHGTVKLPEGIGDIRQYQERVKRLEAVMEAGIALMRATDPFVLHPDAENDDGITIRQLGPDANIGWEEAPKAGEHIALHDSVLSFGRAVFEAKETKP